MRFLRLSALSLLVLPLLALSVHSETNTLSGSVADEPEIEEWPYTLPIFGKEAVAQGYEIPLPYGIGFSHMYAERGIDVTSIKVDIFGSGLTPVNDIVRADVETTVNTTVGRLDTWIFPFMNIYGFVGHVDNNSDVTLSLNTSGTNVNVDTQWDLSGPTYGGGIVLAGGYLDYFMTIDANFFKADLTGDLSEEFVGSTYTARAGWNGKMFNNRNTRFWLGASYWKTESTITGSTPILGGLSTLSIEVEQEPKNPGNINIGGYVEITRRVHFVFDYGTNFDDATTVLAEINFRIF